MNKIYKSIGLMSGTSMDGIDLALIESDGKRIIRRTHFDYLAYDKDFKTRLTALIYNTPKLAEIKLVENELTLLHAKLVNQFLAKNKIARAEIDLIAFHGHTILHLPKQLTTWQIGNAHLLARETGIDVVADFRTRDVALGGQGAPLVPIYHFYLFANQTHPVAVLNIGGISNITYLGLTQNEYRFGILGLKNFLKGKRTQMYVRFKKFFKPRSSERDDLLRKSYYFQRDSETAIEAFDVCFGNAPLDDLVKKKLGCDFDQDGNLAGSGKVDFVLAEKILENEIFNRKPPKSFDRDDFSSLLSLVNNLKVEDALATFAFMHARALQINLNFLSQRPKEIFVCGGGRKNAAMMRAMQKLMPEISIKAVEEIGLNGDAIEAEAFAFLGIRSLLGLPISFANTTGVKSPDSACGGVFYRK